jgi:hypothetical protein
MGVTTVAFIGKLCEVFHHVSLIMHLGTLVRRAPSHYDGWEDREWLTCLFSSANCATLFAVIRRKIVASLLIVD